MVWARIDTRGSADGCNPQGSRPGTPEPQPRPSTPSDPPEPEDRLVVSRSALGVLAQVKLERPRRGHMTAPARAVDVLVVGCGLAGLCAGVAAADQGARVLVVEKAEEPGGSSALSGGYVWTFLTREDYCRAVPQGDPVLGGQLAEDFETGVEWLQEHGAGFEPKIDSFSPDDQSADLAAHAYRFKPDPVSGGLLPLTRALEQGSGTLECATQAVALAHDGAGAVAGVRLRCRGSTELVKAGAVVLATGGFQGNLEMMTRYVSPFADRFLLRSAPTATGDGIRMAFEAGAAASRGLRAFYGHLMPAPPAEVEPGAFRRMSQFYSRHTVLLNLDGMRFIDEALGDATMAMALGSQRDALGLLVFDADSYRDYVCRPYVHDAPSADPLGAIEELGGVVLRAPSLEMLVEQLAARGVSAVAALRTLQAHDEAVANGRPDLLEVPRSANFHRLQADPFYAVPVIPGATFTEGGIRVGRACDVIGLDGEAIPGLYAAGTDVGGISYVGYAGGLSAALTTGLRAGVHAAMEADGR